MHSLFQKINTACLSGEAEAIHLALVALRKEMVRINNGATGIIAPDSKSMQAVNACAAEPGSIPLWGQPGFFYIIVNDMPVVVSCSPVFMASHTFHMEFYAVNPDIPFISETGFYSHFESRTTYGLSVEDAARVIISNYQKAKRLKKPASVHAFDWLANMQIVPVDVPQRLRSMNLPNSILQLIKEMEQA